MRVYVSNEGNFKKVKTKTNLSEIPIKINIKMTDEKIFTPLKIRGLVR